MKLNRIECCSCEGVYKVTHDMDAHYYRVEHCTFCGEVLEMEIGLEEDDFEDEDE